MLDVKYFLGNAEQVEAALLRRGIDGVSVQHARECVDHARAAQRELESMRAQTRDLERSSDNLGRLQQMKIERKGLREKCKKAELEMSAALAALPNLPHPSTPDGLQEDCDVLVSECLNANFPSFGNTALDSRDKPVDPELAARVTGSGFEVLRGDEARILRALTNFALELNGDEFEELSLPALVSEASMMGSAHLPKFASGAYSIADTALWLAPTAEVAFCALHREARIHVEDLPVRYVAHVPCFRREIGGGGSGSRFRLHQYHQVELFSACDPARSLDELLFILDRAEQALRRLELRYRVIELCSGQLPFSAAKAFKIELFLPRSDQWIDVSTVSLATDFLARRSDLCMKGTSSKVYLHTVNASALACSRVRLALTEYGYGGGSDSIPMALRAYLSSNNHTSRLC